MDFDEIFAEYYTLYRAEAEVPANDDDEYIIAMQLANNAIRRWANYDNTYWKELFALSNDSFSDGTVTTVAGTTTYDAPSDMKEAGGYVKVIGGTGNMQMGLPLIDPQEGQFKGDQGRYAFFTGDPNNGFVLNLNQAPTASGETLQYMYYRLPDLITQGSDRPQMSNPAFMVDFMLANRFRASRNPYYSTAKRDAENALGQMKMANDSGGWANPWSVADRSGSVWGAGDSNTWSF
jgi:hypothetical protein